MKPKKDSKIGRPEGVTKTKKSLTIETSVLECAAGLVANGKFASLSALAERAIQKLIEQESSPLPPPPSGLAKNSAPPLSSHSERCVNPLFFPREKRSQKRP